MDKPRVTPRDFFLWAGAMITLYASVFAFLSLIFSYLNYAIPDPLAYYSGDPYVSGVSYEMASLIVLLPIFLVLMRIIHGDIARDASRAQVWVRRWALYLTLFIAGATIAGDLITLVMYFFNGDVTLRFALKVLLVLLVAGGGFLHFLADLREYWQRNPGKSQTVGVAIGGLALLSIVTGFFVIGTPWQARLYRYDDQKVSDLETIQSQIVSYWQAKQELPVSLAALSDSISGFVSPVDPQTSQLYEYTVKGAQTFELCANFNAVAQPYSVALRAVPVGPAGYPSADAQNNVWNHGAGRTCFTRMIDPQLYPSLKR